MRCPFGRMASAPKKLCRRHSAEGTPILTATAKEFCRNISVALEKYEL